MAKQRLPISQWPDFREYVAESMVNVIAHSLLNPGSGILSVDSEGWIRTNTWESLVAFVYGGDATVFNDNWGRMCRHLAFIPNDVHWAIGAPDGVSDWEAGEVTNINDFDDPGIVVTHIVDSFLSKSEAIPDRVPGKLAVSLVPSGCENEAKERSFRISITKDNLYYRTFHVEVNGKVGEKVVNDGRSMRSYTNSYSSSGLRFVVYGETESELIIRPLCDKCGVKFNTMATGKWHDAPFSSITGAVWD